MVEYINIIADYSDIKSFVTELKFNNIKVILAYDNEDGNSVIKIIKPNNISILDNFEWIKSLE